MDKIINEINKAWNWKGFNATQIIQTNDFGNVIFKTDSDEYWRICPEETSCEKIAKSKSEFDQISTESEFIDDWEMTNLVKIAITNLGELEKNQKYCLKIQPVIGGKYEKSNFEKINFSELISFSGNLGFKLKELKDGQKIKLKIKN